MNKRLIRAGVVLLGLCVFLGGQISGIASIVFGSNWLNSPEKARAAVSAENSIFLPVITKYFPFTTPFGADMGKIIPANGLYQMTAVGTSWLRGANVRWSEIEPNKNDRKWAILKNLNAQLASANRQGLKVIVTVTSTPTWAQKVSGYYCGPIKDTEFAAFAAFMRDLVSRYSVEPYNVKYWELWNEPDVLLGAVEPRSVFGCWGADEPYFGGGYFASMLKAVYPVIKSADPDAQVVVGGLLLDCNPSGGCGSSDPRPPKFLEGILRHNGDNDGGDYFDGVSFHAYDYYSGSLGRYVNPKWNSNQSTGPAVIAKANYLLSLLNNPDFGAPGKFLMNTETALICGKADDPPGQPPCSTQPNSAFEKTKAYYVAQVYAAGQALNLKASIWYSVFGWRNSSLLNTDLSIRPAYTAYGVARRELLNSNLARPIWEYPYIQGYEFNRVDRRVWVVWSSDGNTHAIDLPGSPLRIYNALGSVVPIVDPLVVSGIPLYLEWTP